MNPKNLIVFDIDGTITDSVKVHQKAFYKMLIEIGVSKIDIEFNSFMHHTDSYIAKEIYENDQDLTFSQQKLTEFENGLNEKIKLENFNEVAGAKKLIEKLEKENDFGICYATGSLRKPAEYKLKSIGINFKDIQLVASNNILERENIVKEAILNAKIHYKVKKFDRIICVGDGLWDLLTAKNLNVEFIGIGLKNKEILIENGAKIVLENLIDFTPN